MKSIKNQQLILNMSSTLFVIVDVVRIGVASNSPRKTRKPRKLKKFLETAEKRSKQRKQRSRHGENHDQASRHNCCMDTALTRVSRDVMCFVPLFFPRLLIPKPSVRLALVLFLLARG